MSSLKVDRYYDITCAVCGYSRSTDYNAGMDTNLNHLRKVAEGEGWKVVRAEDTDDGTEGTLCPSCAAKCKYRACRPSCGDKYECELCMVNGYCKPALAKAEERNPNFVFR